MEEVAFNTAFASLARGLTSAVVRLASMARAEEECGVDSSSQMRVSEPDSRAEGEGGDLVRVEGGDLGRELGEGGGEAIVVVAGGCARGCERV